jgi:ABC-type phosphate transport system substrate-binding protein
VPRLRRLLLCLTLVALAASGEPAPGFKVVVHPDNPLSALDKKSVAEMFLKKLTRWPGGELVRPVDLATENPTRQGFSREVLDRSVPAVKNYWQQLIFSGRDVPPPELESDEAVVKFVLKRPGAIGYVSAGADVSTVKVLALK